MPVKPNKTIPNLIPRALRFRFMAGAVALSLAALVSPSAWADDEEEDLSFEQSIIRTLLGGGSPSIDYRERSPLVIPPSRDLPPPDTGAPAQRASAWPQDPDQQRRQAARGPRPALDFDRQQGRALSPDELRRGARGGARGVRPQQRAVTLSDSEMGRPLTPAELGETRSVFGLVTNAGKQETATFTKEPERRRMTDPPAGYRTPSGSQPYAAPSSRATFFKVPSFFDRGIPSEDR